MSVCTLFLITLAALSVVFAYLYSDIDKIHGGIGDKVALLLQWLATFLGGFIVGFVREWRLTLLLLVFTPFLAIGGFLMSRVGMAA